MKTEIKFNADLVFVAAAKYLSLKPRELQKLCSGRREISCCDFEDLFMGFFPGGKKLKKDLYLRKLGRYWYIFRKWQSGPCYDCEQIWKEMQESPAAEIAKIWNITFSDITTVMRFWEFQIKLRELDEQKKESK